MPSSPRNTMRQSGAATAGVAALALALGLLASVGVSQAAHIVLEWTAPGDDGTLGRAVEYDLRWSLRSTQFPSRFFTASRIPLPPPGPAGSLEHIIVSDLPKGSAAYFALRTRDENGNWSAMSNILAAQYVTDAEGAPGTLDFSAPAENPVHGPTTFTLTLPERGLVKVEAVDVAGRLLRTMQSGDLAAGRHSVAWDLRDDGGRTLASGVYFVRARTNGQTFVRRVVVVR